MDTCILVDGDLVAHTIAAVKDMTLERATKIVDKHLAWCRRELNAARMLVLLSSDTNFRKQIMPSYKFKRKKVPKPPLLIPLKDYLRETYGAFSEGSLEADDLMGLLMTSPIPGERTIMVSKDKDMRQIPGELWNPDKPELGIQEITHKEADRWFWTQVITGDSTDGYPGIPGVGPTGAAEILDGAPKGEIWNSILKEFQFYLGGCHEFARDFAVRQLTVARILRAGEYDWETKQVLPFRDLLPETV